MEAARQAISGITGRGGMQDTTVDEAVNPAVTSETVKPHRHEETTEAVDREVHQDHYHTTVQPITHQETLPEMHTHNLVPQVERTFQHGDVEQDKARVAADLGQFRDASTTVDTTHSTMAAPTQVGEHVHHHVHEVVQPIIHKETIRPEVVHTTIPVHEKHLAPSEHHGLSTLPMKTMDEFKSLGQVATGGNHSVSEYEGHPKPYNQEFQPHPRPVDKHPEQHLGTHDPVATGHFEDSRRPSDSAAGVLGGTSTTGHGAETGAGERVGGIDAFHGSSSNTHGSGVATGAAVGAAAAAGTGLAAEHHHDRGLGTSGTSTDLAGSNVGSGSVIGSGSTNPSQRGTHDAALAGGTTAAGTSITSAGYPDRNLRNTTGTTSRMEGTDSTLGHEGAATGALPSRVVDSATAHDSTTTAGGNEPRDLYDEQAARPPVAAATSGRKTKHGYTTSADLGPNFGKTKHGYTTGAGGKHGPQDTTETSHGGAAAGTTTDSPAEEHASTRKQEEEPKNFEGGAAKDPDASTGHHDDGKQHASEMGDDPNLVESKGKWTGTGEPGSHSALFGLTPDGKTIDDTGKSGNQTTKLETTPSEQEDKKAGTGGEDLGSRDNTRSEIAEQMHDPRVAEKGHEGKAEYGTSDGKPGAGA